MDELSRVAVVLPSLDPDEKLTAVVDGLISYGFSRIVMVNDGSHAENVHYFTDIIAAHPKFTLLTHEVNRGKGAAMKTAFTWIMENLPDTTGVVTVDGDNQHHPEDTRACVEHMLKTGRITLGARDFSQPDVPPRSRFGNRTTSAIFKIFCGITITDTQTGLRAFPMATLPFINGIFGDRYEYETNMLLEMKNHGYPFDEVKIRTVYIEENKSSHFHVLRDSWRIYKLILAHFFRYTLSSVACFVLDAGLLYVLNVFLRTVLLDPVLTVVTEAGARVCSSLVNFYLNKKLVFRSDAKTGKALLRYYALAIPQMLAQMVLTYGAYKLFGIAESRSGLRTVLHIVVMAILFLLSFTIQRRWVFANENKTER